MAKISVSYLYVRKIIIKVTYKIAFNVLCITQMDFYQKLGNSFSWMTQIL